MMTREITDRDKDAVIRSMFMWAMTPERLDAVAADHSDSEDFGRRVIEAAATQVAAAKRRAAAYDAERRQLAEEAERVDVRALSLTKRQLDDVIAMCKIQIVRMQRDGQHHRGRGEIHSAEPFERAAVNARRIVEILEDAAKDRTS